MSDRVGDGYLWDRSGPPDPEIAELERVLGSLRLARLDPPAASAATATATAPAAGRSRRPPRRVLAAAVVAGALALAAGVALLPRLARQRMENSSAPAASPAVAAPWTITPLAGTPQLDDVAVTSAAGALASAVVTTNGEARARIALGGIGQVELDPGTRVRLLEGGDTRHRLALDRGVLHALIWAPPGRFHVETPAGVVTDLGCSYTLAVDEQGHGTVTVISGWVGFDYRGRESLIPAGATSTLDGSRGPGSPLYPEASPRLRGFTGAIDAGLSLATVAPLLRPALAEARVEDAVTLWHLLARVPPQLLPPVNDRLAALVPPPAGVTRSGILAGDAPMRDRWWDALSLGRIADWRYWKATEPPAASGARALIPEPIRE